MKIFILLVLAIIAIIPMYVKATDRHPPDVYNTYNTYNQYVSESGMALAMAAAGMNSYWATTKTQVAVSAGRMDDENAGMVSVAKRFCESCPLLQGTLGRYDGETGIGIGALWLID